MPTTGLSYQLAGIVEPGVAAFGQDRRIVAPGRARGIRFGVAQGRALGRGLGDLREGDVGHLRIHVEDGGGRRLLDGGEGLEAVVLLAGAVSAAAQARRKTTRWSESYR